MLSSVSEMHAPFEFDENVKRVIDECSQTIVLARNQILFRAGDLPDAFFIISTGKVKLSRCQKADGVQVREAILTILGGGDILNELAVCDPKPRLTTATALTRTQIRYVPGTVVDHLIHTNEAFSRMMMRYLGRRIRAGQETISSLIINDVAGRVAQVVLSLTTRFGERHSDGIWVQHDITQSDIAMMVGASREAVNKALTDFAARGWMRLGTKNFLIFQEDRLRNFVHANDSAPSLPSAFQPVNSPGLVGAGIS
jgi:CRP-like cAMP-binding protein